MYLFQHKPGQLLQYGVTLLEDYKTKRVPHLPNSPAYSRVSACR